MKRGKKYQEAAKQVDRSRLYETEEAVALVKKNAFAKFDETIEAHIRTGCDGRHADQQIRGAVVLPHGTGKTVRVLVLCTPDKEAEAQEAGADYVGLDDYIEKIKTGWTDVDVIICTPSVMAKVGALGRILGPRGLMPNPKTGTVTMEVGKAIKEVKAGTIDSKVDKTGIIHAGIGKVSFSAEQIRENAAAMIDAINKLKPQTLKGTYMKAASICSTMSPGIKLDVKAIAD
jgi:large subunit ribosomal protein L1